MSRRTDTGAMPGGESPLLIVEDDEADALLIQEALSNAGWPASSCQVVSDGTQAVGQAERARPRLIFLDLNMTGRHGLEILSQLKCDVEMRAIPVVVLSSSRHPVDVERSYALHANIYIVKPVALDEFNTVIASVYSCFLEHAEPALASHGRHESEHPVLDNHPGHHGDGATN